MALPLLVGLAGAWTAPSALLRPPARTRALVVSAVTEEQPVRSPIDESSTVLVVGASRGLGLEFVSQCLRRGATVFATHRGAEHGDGVPSSLEALGSWWDAADRLHPVCMDVADERSIAGAVAEIRRVAGSDTPLTHVIHNAGIYGPRAGFGAVTKADLLSTLEINAVGPVLVAQAVAGLLRRPVPRGLLGRLGPGQGGQLPVYAIMSSKMGSIEDNTSGGAYAYRMSKAAVNVAAKSLHHDLQGTAAVVLLHPGYVRTDMTGGSGLIDVDQSVAGLLRAVEATDGTVPFRWVDYKADIVPW